MPTPSDSSCSPSLPQTEPPANFEAAVNEIEQIVQGMETNPQNSLDLEAAIAAYERGVELLRYCYARLEVAEQRIQVLDDSSPKEQGL